MKIIKLPTANASVPQRDSRHAALHVIGLHVSEYIALASEGLDQGLACRSVDFCA